jgi:hypothetical protein
MHLATRVRRACAWFALVWLLSLVGCGGPRWLSASLPRPARLAVRAFPNVYVVATADIDAGSLAEALSERLQAQDGRPRSARVQRISPEQLMQRRASGALPSVSIVISVSVAYQEEYRPDFQARPLTVCGPGGCGFAARGRLPDLTMLRAEARFVVEDGPSGRRLDVVTLEARDEGADSLSMRFRALWALRQAMEGLVDDGRREVEVALQRVDDPRARAALASAEAGEWAASAGRYGQRVASADFARLPPRARAVWLFNLAQTARVAAYAVGANPAAGLDAAAEHLRAAMALDPQPLYARALADLTSQRREAARAAAQHDAAAHNFGLVEAASPPPVAPAVPEGYR